jgi:hypothetical protein
MGLQGQCQYNAPVDAGQGPPAAPPASTDSFGLAPAIVGVLCFAGAEAAALASIDVDGTVLSPAWPASGLLLGALLLTPRRRWLAAAVAWGAMVLSLALHGASLPGAALLAALRTAESLVAALAIARFVRGRFDLSRPAHLFPMVGASALTPCLTGLVVAFVATTGSPAALGEVWLTYWFAGSLGLFLGAPLVLGWRQWRATPPLQRASGLELGVLLGVVVLMAEAIYGVALPDVIRAPSYVLPAILWAAFRLGPGGTAAAMLTVVTIGLWHTVRSDGPYSLFGLSPALVVLRAQGAAILTSVSVVLLAGLVAERRRIFGELERADAEIRTLRGLIPICAWCHKVRDDAGFWQRLETYLGHRTEATFSHGICPACAEHQEHDLSAHRAEQHARRRA